MTRDLYILQEGYLFFGKGIGSDHRCLWVDIWVIVLMGHNLEPPRKFAVRRLTCNDP
jgi:hypothetical protein